MNSIAPDTTPTVSFTIDKFHPIGGGHNHCHFSLSLANGGNAVAWDGTTLTVTETTDIRFQVNAGYLLNGVVFDHIGGGKPDPGGAAAFPTANLAFSADGTTPSSTLTIHDLDASADNYEFSLLVQRLSDQRISLIDPPIDNKPD